MKKNFNKLLTISLLSGLAFAACGGRCEKTLGTPENPLILALSAPYAEKLSAEDAALLEELLSAETGLSIKAQSFKDSVSIIKDLGEEKADLAFLTLDEYLLAREEFKAEPLLRVLRGKGNSEYKGAVFVLDKSIKTVKDLAGKKIAMSNPYSVSGFILPGLLFAENGITVEPVFTGSHEASAQKLLKGEADAAAVYRGMGDKYKNLILLALSEAVPNEPVAARKSLDREIKARAEAALLKISQDPEGAAIINKMADITGFEKVDAKVYKDIHEKILGSGKTTYSLIPDGIRIKKLSEPYYFD